MLPRRVAGDRGEGCLPLPAGEEDPAALRFRPGRHPPQADAGLGAPGADM